jgi:hypothetical protein
VTRTDEMRKLISEMGISQREAAKQLDIDDRTFRYWAAANPEPPTMAIYALRYLKDHSSVDQR